MRVFFAFDYFSFFIPISISVKEKQKWRKKNIDFKRLALPQYEYMWMDGRGEMCRQTLNVHIFFVKNFFLLFTFYSNANGREQIECRNKQTTVLSTREMLFFSSSNFYLVEFVIQKLYCRLLLISASNPLHWNMTCWAISIFFSPEVSERPMSQWRYATTGHTIQQSSNITLTSKISGSSGLVRRMLLTRKLTSLANFRTVDGN